MTTADEIERIELETRRTRAEAAQLEAEAAKLDAEAHKLAAERGKLMQEELKLAYEGTQIKSWERWAIPAGMAALIAVVAATATKVWFGP